MGYTHSWNPSKVEVGEGLVEDAKRIAAKSGVKLAGWDGAGDPQIEVGVISLNGAGKEACETFRLDTACNRQVECCKTAEYPYDPVVCAILLAADERCGGIGLRSDGYWSHEWKPARALFAAALGREPKPAEGMLDDYLVLRKEGARDSQAWKRCDGSYRVQVEPYPAKCAEMDSPEFADFMAEGGYAVE